MFRIASYFFLTMEMGLGDNDVRAQWDENIVVLFCIVSVLVYLV